MQLIIGYTCVGVFVATALAVVLNLFGWVKIDDALKKKLHVALVLEIVAISLVTFADLAKFNTEPASDRMKISASATADKLDDLLVHAANKELDDDPEAISKAVKQAMFIHFTDLSDDEQLLEEALSLLAKRGQTNADINTQLLDALPSIAKSKHDWLVTVAAPMLAEKEVSINNDPRNQQIVRVNVPLPDELKLAPDATIADIPVDRAYLDNEAAHLTRYLDGID